MIISQLSISPFGESVSVSKHVKKVIKVIKKHNVTYETNAMATIIETKDLQTLFDIVKEAHIELVKSGAKRVITELKIDDRLNKNATMESKLKAIR